MTFDNWEYHPDNLPSDHKERNAYLQSVEDDFYNNIWAQHGRKGFFADYTEEACEQFVKSYGYQRQKAVLNAKQTIRQIEGPREMRYRPETEHVYDMLLQKKLFNLQCLWRAEQAEVPGIWMAWHFHYWSEHIRECPFIEPVTDAEIQTMQAFLLDDNYEDTTDWWLPDWQDYDELTEQDADGDYPYMPEWYEFYDGRMGTTYLLGLPDVRGEKELVYRKLMFQKAHEEYTAKQAATAGTSAAPEPHRNSYCPVNAEMCYAFALKFEDGHFQAIFKHLWNEQRRKEEQEEDYDVEDYIETLEDAETPPIVTGGVNWREALKRTAQQYKNSIIADDLELLHSEYSLLQTLAPQPTTAELQARYDADGLVAMVRDQILDGRELMGEPRDFNF